MDIFINTKDKAAPLLFSRPTCSPFTMLRYKRGGDVPLRVTLIGVSNANYLRVGIKRKGNYETPLLAYAEAAQPASTSGGNCVFNLTLRVASAEIDRLLNVSSGDGSGSVPDSLPDNGEGCLFGCEAARNAFIPAETEISWMEGDTTRTTDSTPSAVLNDILRNDDPPEAVVNANTSAIIATTKAAEAAASATAAAASETAAGDSATAADASATDSADSATEAGNSAAAAAASATAAAASATDAADSATYAQDSANSAQDYAGASQNSATDSAASATAASASATAAATSETNANLASTSAAASASEASDSASDAQLHADRAEGVVQAHAEDTALHLSTQDRTNFNHINSLFHQVIPEGTVAAPDDCVPDEWFTEYFARNAQPGDATHPRMVVAPGNVFVSRVPYARKKSDGSWENTSCAMDATVYDEDTDIRLLDNSGLRHKCSTDKTENVDSYVGKRWAFFWARCNYKRDAYGVKWVTAVEGETIGLPDGTTAVFDPAKPTGVFGPSIWTFCTPDTGWGTEDDGTPNFQLWGIGDSPWSALSAERKAWLTAHGVDETKYRPWSTGLWYDGETWQRRSYIVDSAYCGTAEVGSDGSLTGISSKYNEPVAGGLSHNIINTKLGNFGGGGVRACALAMVFDIVKNATKNSQNIHYGMASNSNNGVACDANTLNAGYVFPIASKGNFEVGCTVYLRTTSVSSAGGTSYVRSKTNQIGRITAIENRDIEVIVGDPTGDDYTTETKNKLCLVIDPNTVEPFFARTTTAYATALTGEGVYACAYATQGICLAGETHAVIGKHDGYVSGTNGRHPYRVQGMEMMSGVYQCAADCVVVKGTGSLEIELPDGSTATPTTSQYVYLYAPPNVTHRQSGSLAQYISGGYVPVGIGTTTAGYVYNGAVDPYWGVWYITHTGASDHTGHADNSYMGASPAEFLAGGALDYGSVAGSAFLGLHVGLGASGWYFGARD